MTVLSTATIQQGLKDLTIFDANRGNVLIGFSGRRSSEKFDAIVMSVHPIRKLPPVAS